MTISANNSGGSVAIRGFLVQTLVALLDIAQTDPPFTEITLEPTLDHEQFDFLWKDAHGSHATQVKSTINTFGKSDVEKWVKKLQAARTHEHCRLILVGKVPSSLDGIKSVELVDIEAKNLNLTDLLEQAAHRLAKFLETEGMHTGTGLQREMIVHALVSQLEHLSTRSERLTREAFIKILRQWIGSAPKGDVKIDLSHFDVMKYAPIRLIGRETEEKLLNDTWLQAVRGESKRPRIITFVALGGEGKTSLVAKWAADLANQDWPGCDAVFAWSFYHQDTDEKTADSSDLFLKEALIYFGDSEMAASPQHPREKGRRLAHLVGERRALLILDGLEPLQYPLTSPMREELKDPGLAALLKGLATHNDGLCLVTTRYAIPDLRAFIGKTVQEEKLECLSMEAGIKLLKLFNVKGNDRKIIPSADGRKFLNEFEKLVEDVKGHALTLNLLGSYLRDAHAGDIRRRDLVKLEEADNVQGGPAFRVMDAYVESFENGGKTADDKARGRRALALLHLLGLFDRPATADCLEALWKGKAIIGLTEPLFVVEKKWLGLKQTLHPISESQRNMSLQRLEDARLLTVNRDASRQLVSLDAHPLLREYFGQRLRAQHPKTWCAAHRRLYEHLCATTPDKPDATLEDLQPLYQAVAHGCQAGLQVKARANVYRSRILRGEENYSMMQLGTFGSDLGAIACFFQIPWSRCPAFWDADQVWLLTEPPSACAL